ncbi:MAG: tautomerase family protein [Coriobacteriia bacterium]|nr:tautomerase family protein [Coriobacteriia bacterium]
MPFVRIEIQAGKTGQYRRALLHGVRRALVEALGVPDERIMQRIAEYEPSDLDVPETKSDRLTLIEISMLPRDGAVKRDLYERIVHSLALSPGVSADDVMIVVNEPHRECFGICGEVPEEPGPHSA